MFFFLVVFRFSVHLKLIIFFLIFVYLWSHWVFVVRALSLVAGAALSFAAAPSHCGDFSCCGPQAECRLSSCGSVFIAPRHVEPSQIRDQVNPWPLHWQVDSYPLHHQRSPWNWFLYIM